MSKDEIFILVFGLALSAWVGGRWYWHLATPRLAKYPGYWRQWLGVAPLAWLVGLFIVLRSAASFDVREAGQYIAFYLVLGAAWIFCAAQMMALFGVSVRDDAIERRNPAAAILVIAAMAGQTAVYAGGNIGDGPGWWVVILAAAIGGATWCLLWWIVESMTGASEEITVGRDIPMAVRLGGYMIASGILCGRGVAGDWVSLANTVAELGDAWSVLLLLALAIGIERLMSGGALSRSIGFAMAVAVAYIAFAVFAVSLSAPLADSPAYPATPEQAGL